MTDLHMIEINQLTRVFKDKTALNQISLSIQQGELFGLVGPDGAGKTTLLRTLAGLLVISEGKGTVSRKNRLIVSRICWNLPV